MIARCAECGLLFNTDRYRCIQGRESGKWLCPDCVRGYNDLASRIMVKAFQSMDDLLRQSFAIDTLPGWGDFDEEVRHELQN